MDEQSTSKAWLITIIVIGLVLITVGVLILHRQDTIKPESTFSLDTPTKNPNPSGALVEPDILSWRTYSNQTYNFSIDVPEEWHQQEYPSPQPNGGFQVAFSPDDLPCGTCTYFRNGYYSVRLYNQKTDPDYYKDFQGRVASIGKAKGFQGIQLGKFKGVLTANLVAFDHGDWVYEISLDTHDGNLNVADSKIFQKALTSFKFTELLFGN